MFVLLVTVIQYESKIISDKVIIMRNLLEYYSVPIIGAIDGKSIEKIFYTEIDKGTIAEQIVYLEFAILVILYGILKLKLQLLGRILFSYKEHSHTVLAQIPDGLISDISSIYPEILFQNYTKLDSRRLSELFGLLRDAGILCHSLEYHLQLILGSILGYEYDPSHRDLVEWNNGERNNADLINKIHRLIPALRRADRNIIEAVLDVEDGGSAEMRVLVTEILNEINVPFCNELAKYLQSNTNDLSNQIHKLIINISNIDLKTYFPNNLHAQYVVKNFLEEIKCIAYENFWIFYDENFYILESKMHFYAGFLMLVLIFGIFSLYAYFSSNYTWLTTGTQLLNAGIFCTAFALISAELANQGFFLMLIFTVVGIFVGFACWQLFPGYIFFSITAGILSIVLFMNINIYITRVNNTDDYVSLYEDFIGYRSKINNFYTISKNFLSNYSKESTYTFPGSLGESFKLSIINLSKHYKVRAIDMFNLMKSGTVLKLITDKKFCFIFIGEKFIFSLLSIIIIIFEFLTLGVEFSQLVWDYVQAQLGFFNSSL